MAKTFFNCPNLLNYFNLPHLVIIYQFLTGILFSEILPKIRHFKANRAATPGEELIKILFVKYKTFNNPHLFNTKPQILIHNRVHNARRKRKYLIVCVVQWIAFVGFSAFLVLWKHLSVG